jgi:hypothetical protein
MNPLIQFRTTIPPLLVSVLFVCFAVPAAHSATELFSANLSGENEVPPINTAGSATFRMEVGSTITFSLTFSGLSSPRAVAHLHFAPNQTHCARRHGRYNSLCRLHPRRGKTTAHSL